MADDDSVAAVVDLGFGYIAVAVVVVVAVVGVVDDSQVENHHVDSFGYHVGAMGGDSCHVIGCWVKDGRVVVGCC